MTIYIILAIFYMFCIPLEKTILKRISRKTWALLLIIPLFCITAFKDISVGSDTYGYKSMYDVLSQQQLFSEINTNMEVGYVFINRLLGFLNVDFYGFQIIYSIFVYYSLIKFLCRYSKNIAFSIYFYVVFRFLFFTMSGIRQTISISILLLSVYFIEKRQPIRFFLSVAIATLIHSSSIVFAALYFLPITNLNFKNIVKIIGLGICVIIGSDFFIKIFISIFPKYSTYLNRIGSYDGIFVYIQTLVILSFLMLGVFLEKRDNLPSDKLLNHNIRKNTSVDINKISLNALTLAFAFSLFALKINIAGRVGRYFNMFLMIYLPNEVETTKDKIVRILIYYILLVFLFIYYVVIMKVRPEWEGIIPYHWVWKNF